MSKFIYFVAGLSIGVIGGLFAAKLTIEKKFNETLDEERKELRAYYKGRYEKEEAKSDKEKEVVKPRTDNVVNISYRETKEEKKENRKEEDMPYTIDENEFGEIFEYDQICLTLYADGVVADNSDEQMDMREVKKIVGEANLKAFEYSKDEITYIRNDKMKAEYEITKDLNNYYDRFN